MLQLGMTKLERLYSLAEYVLAGMFIHGGINIFVSASPEYLSGVFGVLVGQYAIYVYGVLFTLIGLGLLYGKLKRFKKVHKHCLMFMYLSCVYVLALAIAVNGVQLGLLTTVITGIVSAFLWIRWTFKTEYIDPKDFRKDVKVLT